MTIGCPPVTRLALAALLLLSRGAMAQAPFNSAVDYVVGTNPAGVVAADLNGDGWPDMAVTTDLPDRVGVLLNTGSDAFGLPTNIPMPGGSGPHGVVAFDVDHDQDLDLVVTLKNSDQVQVLTNTAGAFSLGAATALPTGSLPRDLIAGDLDGNGFADVVTSNRDSDDLSVLLNFGGAFSAPVAYPVALRPRGLAFGDFNGDGWRDLAVAGSDDREVSVLLNSGSGGTFGAATGLSVGTELRPDGVTVRDLDQDGDVDIAASTSGAIGDFVSVFLNAGGGAFPTRTDYPVGGVNPGGIAASDFDGDGDVDVCTANQGSASVSFLPNLGAAILGTPSTSPVGTTPEALIAADLDGNGSPDLVVTNRDSGTVSVLLSQASTLVFADGFESGGTGTWSTALP